MKYQFRFSSLSIVISFIFLLALPLIALAQDATGTRTPLSLTPTPTPFALTSIAPVQNIQKQAPPPLPGIPPLPPNGRGVLELSLANLGAENFELQGDGRIDFQNFYLPKFIRILPGASLKVDYGYTSNAVDQTPSIDVEFNQKKLGTLSLNEEISQTVNIFDLDELINVQGRNRVEFSLQLNTDCGVKPPDVHAWIYNTSTFLIPYELIPMKPDLSYYPWPFYERAYRPIETAIILPADPTPANLSAAATIGAGLGKYSEGNAVITTTLDISVTDEILQSHNLIIIGKPGANRLLEQITLPLALDHPTLKSDYGMLQELQSPWNPYRMVLVVSGQTDQALARSTQALNRHLRFPGMSGPVAIVQDVLPPSADSGEARNIDLTFAEMGLEDEVILGALRQQVRLDFDMPRSFELIESPKLFLSFNHSRILDGKLSVLDTYLNGVPVGSTVFLDDSNIEGLVEVDLPPWQLKPGRNRLEIWVEMHLSQDENRCEAIQDPRLWTVIRSNSFIRLPYQATNALPTLALFPYPFDKEVNLDNVALVMPNQPQKLELQVMMDLAINLGYAAGGNYLNLEVMSADKVSPEFLNSHYVVLIGRPSRNSLLRTINDQLPQPFVPDSDLLQSTLDTVVLLPDPTLNVGLLQEVAFSDKNYALVVSGTTDKGVRLATDVLLKPNDLRDGNVTVVKESELPGSETQNLQVSNLDTRTSETNKISEGQPEAQKAGTDAARWLALSQRWW